MSIFIIVLSVYWIIRLILRHRLRSAARADSTGDIVPPPSPGHSVPELAQHLTAPDAPPLNEAQATRLRPLVLHWLGLRTDLAPAQATEQTPGLLKRRWFMLDLQHLTGESDPRAVLAFACLRVAFYLRAAWHLGWIDLPLYTTLTGLNARRVRDCFPDWPSFTHACAQGSAHWQARGRTDVFGEHLGPDHLWAWLWMETAATEVAHKVACKEESVS